MKAPAIAGATDVDAALLQRLSSILPLVSEEQQALADSPDAGASPMVRVGNVLDALVRAVIGSPTSERVWLFLVGMAGCLPSLEVVESALRYFRTPRRPMDAAKWALSYARANISSDHSKTELRVVSHGVVIDLGSFDRRRLLESEYLVTTRVLVPWSLEGRAVPAAWTRNEAMLRSLSAEERSRLLAARPSSGDEATEADRLGPRRCLVLPWRSVVVLPHMGTMRTWNPLTALARFSGNELSVLGYSCAPALQPSLVSADTTSTFGKFLSVVKNSSRLACVGDVAAAEFAGFLAATAPQGLPRPQLRAIRLPVERCPKRPAQRADIPAIVSLGSLDLFGDDLCVLYAAERLWQEGRSFRLVMLTGDQFPAPVAREVARLRDSGRLVEALSCGDDSTLSETLGAARFSVCCALHETGSAAAARSLELGVPAITTDRALLSRDDLAPCVVVVDPFDDEALVEAWRTMLADDPTVERLSKANEERPGGSWSRLGDELWDALVGAGVAGEPLGAESLAL